jgi:hypothetical protein
VYLHLSHVHAGHLWLRVGIRGIQRVVDKCSPAAGGSFGQTLELALRNPDEFLSSHRSEWEMAEQQDLKRMSRRVLGYSVDNIYLYSMM